MRPLDQIDSGPSPEPAPTEPVELTVVVPVKDEATRLPVAAPVLLSFVREHGSAEVLISVDPGCSDRTPAMASDLDSGSPWVRSVSAPSTGKGNALLAGVMTARGRIVLMSDSDLSVDPGQWDVMVRSVRPGTVVIADRRIPGARRIDDPPLRAWMGRLFNVLVRALVLPGLRDTQCGCKAMTTADAQSLLADITTGGWAYDVEMLAKARHRGMRIIQHPVTWTYHDGSQMTPGGALKAVRDVLRLAVRVGRATEPRTLGRD